MKALLAAVAVSVFATSAMFFTPPVSAHAPVNPHAAHLVAALLPAIAPAEKPTPADCWNQFLECKTFAPYDQCETWYWMCMHQALG